MENSEITALRVDPYDNNKKVMYLAKELLLNKEKINIIGGTNSAGTAARAAESLVRLGYVTYENLKTETLIDNNKRRTRFVITIKKTNNFDKLYKENEVVRKQKEAEREKKNTNTPKA